MVKSNVIRGSQVTDSLVAKLSIEALNLDTPETEVEMQLEIMHRPEAIGNENVAYLVFGIPATDSYSFLDLNNLPDGIKVCVTIVRNDVEVSKSEFSGSAGNMPVAP